MVKVKNKKEHNWRLKKHTAGKATAKWATNHLKITPRKFKQIYTQYKNTNTTPKIDQTLGRPKKQITKKQITKKTIKIIKQAYKKVHLNAPYLKKIIYTRQKTSISYKRSMRSYSNWDMHTTNQVNRNVEHPDKI
jgi:hypothetical protein